LAIRSFSTLKKFTVSNFLVVVFMSYNFFW
jgi:hypothetical protein